MATRYQPTKERARNTFFHIAATASFCATPLTIIFVIFAGIAATELDYNFFSGLLVFVSLACLFFPAVGILAGLVALCGIPKYGHHGILLPSLAGIFSPFIAAAAVAYFGLPGHIRIVADAGGIRLRQEIPVPPELAACVERFNKHLPIWMMPGLRLNRLEALPNYTLVYSLTLYDGTTSGIPAGTFEKIFRPITIKNLLRDPEAREEFGRIGAFIMRFSDPKGQPIGEVAISAWDITEENAIIGNEAAETLMASYIEAMNRRVPVILDADTRLDKMELLSDRTILCQKTLLTSYTPDIMETTLRPRMIQKYLTDEDLQIFRELGVSFLDRYKDHRGNEIGEATVGPADLEAAVAKAEKEQPLNLNDTEAVLQRLSKEINDRVPYMLDPETRVDGVEIIDRRTLLFKHTFIRLGKSDIPAGFIEKTLRPNLLANYRQSPDLLFLGTKGISVIYRYQDQKAQLVGETLIGPGNMR